MIFFLLACVKTNAFLYPAEPPKPVEVDPVTIEAKDLDCPEVLPYSPGSDPQCQGLLVPRVRFAEFLRAETAAESYYQSWEDSHEERLEDRSYAEFRYQECEVDRKLQTSKAGAWAIVTPLLVTGALAGGFYLGANIPVSR